MKAVRLHSIGDIRCDEIDIPVPHGEELLIKVGACGVCGSDLPRTFEHGTSSGIYPLTIGHEFAGEVVAVGEKADSSLIGAKGAVFPLIPCRKCDPCTVGKYVMCEKYDYLGSRSDGGFAEYCLLPSEWHLIRSKSASMELLAMTEPACVAQHAVRRAKITAGQFAVIFGAGPIGIMAARWARIFGAKPLLVDIVAEKVEFAKSKGLNAINSREEDLIAAIKSLNNGRLADAAIEGTGSGKALISCVECVRGGGCIALLGNPMGNSELPLKIHSTILRKELEINGVWNSSRAPYPVDEWAYTVKMMDEGRFEATDLITDRPTHEELPAVLKELKDGTRRSVKVMCI